MTRRSALWMLCSLCNLWFVMVLSGCAASQALIPPGTVDADKFLFDRGQEELKERRWLRAREYFRQIVDNYPQSPYRPDAKLAVGDSYIGENSTESLLLAVNEFREFLTFFPTNPRADYAQYRLAYAYSEQMLAPDRDQTATRDTIRELQVFLDRYPNSPLGPDARKLMREAQDRLSESGYRIGLTYFRMRHYLGAINRFREVLKLDPEYTGRDAVYFHLAESLRLTDKSAEALPYYERILAEFEQSQYLEDARKRIAELKVE
ncbi:MAG TPA: outer membrane protein assembly factor BamD [Vicinamibacterales bacterium]|nr:outer membrane protein assembly factor BamD [Vicinamibacterales bacterium]